MKPTFFRFLAATLASLTVLVINANAAVYSPALDFSLNSNPNGVWSYGYSTSLGGQIALHQQRVQYTNGLMAGLQSWLTTTSQPYPAIVYNPTDNTIDLTSSQGHSVWGPHQIGLIPGPGCEYSILRFTAPAAATFVV